MKAWKIFEEMPFISWRWDLIMGCAFLIMLIFALGAPFGA